MDAVIYIRWSSTEQTKGSSLARQRKLCLDHCAAKGWRVVREVRDEGVSAWTGKNAIEGNLAAFIDEVDGGAYPEGVVLVVEQLDRLSRRPVIDMFDWLRSTVGLGVRIATVVGDGHYQTGSFDLTNIIKVAVEADVAHRQSQDKSTKLAASWANKRARQAQGELAVLTRRAPAWLTVEGDPARFVIIEERAAIVRRIYEETANGYGKHSIARRLNQEGVATFGRASGWHSSYIQKILGTTTVLGEMQPGRKPRGAPRETVGDPIAGYYPPVIDADLHARALMSMARRARRVAGRGRRLVNIFSGIAKCGACGERMTFRGKGEKVRADGQTVNEDYLVCDSYQRGRGCDSGMHFNYLAWETAVLNAVLAQAMGDEHFASQREVRALEVEQAELVRRRDAVSRKGEAALALYLETMRPEVKAAWSSLTAEVDECEQALVSIRKRIGAARGAVTPAEHQRRIVDLFDQMVDEDQDRRFQARSRVMEAVHELIGAMRFCSSSSTVEVTNRNGLGASIECVSGKGLEAEFFYRYDPGFFG